jgi:integrase
VCACLRILAAYIFAYTPTMATLYKKPNSPNWFAQFFDADGNRISRSTGTSKKREAEQIAASLEVKERERKKGSGLPKAFAAIIETAAREAHAGELTLARADELIRRLHALANPTFRVVSLEEHLSGWVNSQLPHVSDKTASIYSDMKRRVLAAMGQRIARAPVGELTKQGVEKALVKIKNTHVKKTNRPLTAATANMDLRALRRALQAAVEEGLAKANVAATVRPLPEDDSSERAPFTEMEIRNMLDHPETSKEWRGLILLGAHTGLRLGDLLRLGNSNLEEDYLVIRPEKTKRGRKTLSIPLSPSALAWVNGREGDYFPTLKHVKVGTLSTTFRRIMERAGVARETVEAGDLVKRRSFHSLRHTFTSWLANADVQADVRQRLTGHTSAGIHAKYTHHDSALDRAVHSLPAL